jgi:hypothetical protein
MINVAGGQIKMSQLEGELTFSFNELISDTEFETPFIFQLPATIGLIIFEKRPSVYMCIYFDLFTKAIKPFGLLLKKWLAKTFLSTLGRFIKLETEPTKELLASA